MDGTEALEQTRPTGIFLYSRSTWVHLDSDWLVHTWGSPVILHCHGNIVMAVHRISPTTLQDVGILECCHSKANQQGGTLGHTDEGVCGG